MRIPYPERIPYTYAAVAATLLVIVQLLEHTDKIFSLLCFVFVMLAVAAFNIAGGMFRPAGAYIAFAAILDCLIGLTAKCFLGEPANSNLQVPIRTMEVYAGGMVAMLLAASVDRATRPARPFVVRLFPVMTLRGVYLGAAVMGLLSNLMWTFAPKLLPYSVSHILHNADVLGPFSIILGVIYTVRSSEGKNSVTPFLLCLIILFTVEGVSGFSKQGLLTPIFCWLLGAGIAQYRINTVNLVVLAISGFFLLHYGVPIVQTGKDAIVPGSDLIQNFKKVEDYFLHFDEVNAQYKTSVRDEESPVLYFNQPEGFLDRLSFLSTDDLLIQHTDQEGKFGYEPILEGFENLIPHIFWPDKPVPIFGNVYAHELGLLAEEDTTTGVSFGITADAYTEGGFYGVFIALPLVLACVFCSMSWVAGDVRDHPAAILCVLQVAHVGPEGMLPGTITLILFLVIVLAFGMFSRYVFPLVAAAALPPPQPKKAGIDVHDRLGLSVAP